MEQGPAVWGHSLDGAWGAALPLHQIHRMQYRLKNK